MERINKKGFTLIELLAVIVILAIVLVVTIPSVINSLNSARSKSLQNAASTVADWFQKNYDMTQLNDVTLAAADSTYTSFATTAVVNEMKSNAGRELCTSSGSGDNITYRCPMVESAGVSKAGENLTSAVVKINNNGKVCVTVTANPKGSFYTSAADVQATGGSGC